MIRFVYDDNGDFIFTGTTVTGKRLFKAECDICGHLYNVRSKAKLSDIKCKCGEDKKELTINGETKPLADWFVEFPHINRSTAYQRYQRRKAGKLNLSDTGVLFGKKQEAGIIFATPSENAPTWEEELISELTKGMVTLPLKQAIIRAVKIVSKSISFADVQKETGIFTKLGLDFRLQGESLVDLYQTYDSDVEQLKEVLRLHNLTEEHISSLFVDTGD